MDFVVGQGDVILEDCVPLFQNDFLVSRRHCKGLISSFDLPSTSLSGNKAFEIANSISWVCLDANLFTKAIINNNFDHVALYTCDPL